MKNLRVLLRRFAALFSSGKKAQEITDEIDFHLETETRAHMQQGLSLKEARRKALLDLGGVEATTRAYREQLTLPLVEAFVQDTTFALRQLRRNPGFALTVFAVLTLGICSCVAIFAFVDAALFRPLPYPEPSRLVEAMGQTELFPQNNLSYPDYMDWVRSNNVFDSLAAWTGTGYLLQMGAKTDEVSATRVSSNFFRTLRVSPMLGRDFLLNEDQVGASNTAIISFGAWNQRFSGDRKIIGKTTMLNGLPYTIIGVLPRDFVFAPRGQSQFWTSLRPDRDCEKDRSCHNLIGVGRLRERVSLDVAALDLRAIADRLQREYPDSNRGQGAEVRLLSESIVGPIRPSLYLLSSGAALLMLIALTNVSGLLIARAESRRREMALRFSLGATRGRLYLQLATEAALLVSVSVVTGTGLAALFALLLRRLIPPTVLDGMPFFLQLGPSIQLVYLVSVLSILCVLLLAVVPAFRTPFTHLRGALAEGGRSSGSLPWRRLGSTLVVTELAIAVVLLFGAGLLVRSVHRLLEVSLGFNPKDLATFSVAALDSTYATAIQQKQLAGRIEQALSVVPGVRSVSIGGSLPVTFNGNTDWIRFPGRPYDGKHIEVNARIADVGFFRTLGASLKSGRSFTDTDDASHPPVAVVNQKFVDQFFSGQDAVGKRFGDADLSPSSIKEIVGVVDNIREGTLTDPIWPAVYYPFRQSPDKTFAVVARASGDASSLLPVLDAAVHRSDPGVGTLDQMTMETKIHDSSSAYIHRSLAWLVSGFACVALTLGVVGLYGLIAYSVAQRRREIAVRIALGAKRSMVQAMVLKEAGRLCTIGLLIGVCLALGLSFLASSLLFGVKPWDSTTIACVSGLLFVLALGASCIPAHRAASVPPAEALRVN